MIIKIYINGQVELTHPSGVKTLMSKEDLQESHQSNLNRIIEIEAENLELENDINQLI